ncbi:hypothetical protein ACT7DL_16300 [Bacillus paranthracis]
MGYSKETLMIHSVESFLTEEEMEIILKEINQLEGYNNGYYEAGKGNRSVHTIDGYSVKDTVAVYEPKGRIEITELPNSVVELLNKAFIRNIDNINISYPSVKSPDCWIYLEYGEGQYITPHIDYAHNLERPENPKITGINILLNSEFEGAEFYVQTTGSLDIWDSTEDFTVKNKANNSSPWFEEMKKTKWTVSQQKRYRYFLWDTNDSWNKLSKKWTS